MQCPQHGVEFVLKPAGVSKKTGRPYNAFYVCPTFGCNEKPGNRGGVPHEGGWPAVRQEVAQKVAPEKAVMTKEDWERKEERTNRNILLQVAFKAAIEVYCADIAKGLLVTPETVYGETLKHHSWLLSQMNYEKPATGQNLKPQPTLPTPADIVSQANGAIDDALAEEMEY